MRFDEALIEGKRVIDEQAKDTLQDLSNPENMIIDSSDDQDSGTQPEAISSGMVIQVQQAGLRTQDEHGPQRTQFTEVKSDDILEPGSYAEAIACDQHVSWKNAMREEFASLKSNET